LELSILVYVLLVIAIARTLGEAMSRINEPSIVGELLAGILIGPFVLGALVPWLDGMYTSTFISDLADLGIMFFMLYMGMEFSSRSIVSHMRRGIALAAVGVAVPLVLGLAVGSAFGLEGDTLLFVSLAVSVTALPVTVRILKDLGVLQTKTGGLIVSASLVTDLALLFAMGVLLGGDDGYSGYEETVIVAVGFAVFFASAFLVGRYLVPRLYSLLARMQTGEAAFAFAVIIAISFAVLAEQMGLPSFIGAFVAGMLLRETGKGLRTWARVEGILSGVTLGFLAPIFFVLIGFSVDFGDVWNSMGLLLALTGVALLAKVLGSFIPMRMSGSGKDESLAVGTMMMGKGAVELVFAQLALDNGVIGEDLFSVLVLMAFISTLLAPVGFRYFYNRAVMNGEIDGLDKPAAARYEPTLEP
jgi:Kef-type K+ transport system membrane component KefB